ncbi:MAG: sugar phosphate isomerase/epimerase [Ruminococcaceae bacterium]|nr:sugar phosphate isomerase/epimerase [Oscillospiraceae bacterium]
MKLGLSSCGKELDRALFAAYAEAGIGQMELSLGRDGCNALDHAQAKALADEYGVVLQSYHLPFSPFAEIDISSPDRNLRERTVCYLSELIKKAGSVGIPRFIIHPSGEPIAPEMREEFMQCAQESLVRLADAAEAEGAVMAVENLPRTCLGRNSDEMLALTAVDPRLRVCFDTNHLLGEDPVQFIQKVGHLFVTTHISDYDFVNERHWLPGEGKLDWQAVISALKAVGYDGAWLYELGFVAPDTIARPRDLTCADFARNYEELMAGSVPTILGKSLL